ncbi:4-alpha-glucanotransferase [Crocosphaera sp. UHCC 0190]|uniref:4-alpha-glucanotransferase n=1 Tax=Crocosphaera sp. UHCC 0190 TaxID=3110246 RepID=UPI002B2139E0|nr:4-alpha-glucanotransferase [Crocosphaera sp. UHCC 0190]MEA5512072.1 4-alpha-glucanotransferase [Crocosphaera sp. UHCC 0190]
MTFFNRSSGILLHPTSLPSRFGIGDLGEGPYRFIDFLVASGQTIWQVLPLGPTGYGNSPYLSYSALAGNPLLISPDILYGDGLVTQEDLDSFPEFPADYVDYDLVIQTKFPLLKKASETFKNQGHEELWQEFHQFCDRHAYWLEDYALFMSLHEAHPGKGWHQWEPDLAKREPQALQACKERLGDAIFYHKFLQFEFFRQWQGVKKYANERNIQIFGDIPIYVAYDGADVWAHSDIFCIDPETHEIELMAGVPPDYFSATGQLWGNPVYNWEKVQENNFKWWIQRFKTTLEYFDIVRIDHFRGFQAYWGVPKGETTAMNGEWLEAPGEAFFERLKEELGDLPIVAEDLGVITPEVEALRDKFEFPGMKILHFAFDSDRANPFLPYNYVKRNCVVYTGTHDNNTTVGWFAERNFEEKARVGDYLGSICSQGIHWSLIRLAMGSVANQAVFPLQDLLGLTETARMNTPGLADGNWGWRYRPEMLTPELGKHLRFLTELYGRIVYPEYQPPEEG